MGYNLPEGNNSYLDDCNMICQHCDRKDDVDNGEYHNHMWYCDDCFKELFKVCPKCNICIISVDEEMCEDCLAEKTYDESAEGMFEKLGYKLENVEDIEGLRYVKFNYLSGYKKIVFYKKDKSYKVYRKFSEEAHYVDLEEHKAITQQMKELGWL